LPCAGVDVEWVLADVYDAVDALGASRFDLAVTGIGALGWLPSVQRWALQEAGLCFDSLVEHRSIPWNALGDAMVPSTEHPGEFVLAERPERLALTYTLRATKRSTPSATSPR
jgi:hypothetical protein